VYGQLTRINGRQQGSASRPCAARMAVSRALAAVGAGHVLTLAAICQRSQR
jgi:hypothetical protein